MLEGKMNKFLSHFALIFSHLDKPIFSGKDMKKCVLELLLEHIS